MAIFSDFGLKCRAAPPGSGYPTLAPWDPLVKNFLRRSNIWERVPTSNAFLLSILKKLLMYRNPSSQSICGVSGRVPTSNAIFALIIFERKTISRCKWWIHMHNRAVLMKSWYCTSVECNYIVLCLVNNFNYLINGNSVFEKPMVFQDRLMFWFNILVN